MQAAVTVLNSVTALSEVVQKQLFQIAVLFFSQFDFDGAHLLLVVTALGVIVISSLYSLVAACVSS